MIAVRFRRLIRLGREVPVLWAWLFLVAAAIVLPAITSMESITFRVAGMGMNVRVATYFVVAGVAGILVIPIIWRMEKRPAWLKLMLAMVVWLVLTSLVSRQPPVDWLPTVVRFALYFSAATICYWFARSLQDPDHIRAVARLLPLAILAAAVIPSYAGVAEFIRGRWPL